MSSPVANCLELTAICFVPDFNFPEAVTNFSIPFTKSPEPSHNLSVAFSRSFKESVNSLKSPASSKPNSDNVSEFATVAVTVIWKSSTSAVISKSSGISKFDPILVFLRFKLSANPGIATPITICLLPSEITFPFVALTLEKLSVFKIAAVIIVNGV